MGARRQWWMPFRAPFLTACERFAENTSSSRINLSKRLFYCFILNQAIEFLPNPFRRGCPRPIGCIQRSHAVGGANGTTMVVMLVGGLCRWSTEFPYYSYSRKPTGRKFFVPARTLIVVFLLNIILNCNLKLWMFWRFSIFFTKFCFLRNPVLLREKQQKEGDRFLYVGIVDRKTKMELEPPPLSNYTNNSK